MTAYSFQTDCESEFSVRWKSHLVAVDVVVVVVVVAPQSPIAFKRRRTTTVGLIIRFIYFLFCSFVLVYSLFRWIIIIIIIYRTIPPSTHSYGNKNQLKFILANKLKYVHVRIVGMLVMATPCGTSLYTLYNHSK